VSLAAEARAWLRETEGAEGPISRRFVLQLAEEIERLERREAEFCAGLVRLYGALAKRPGGRDGPVQTQLRRVRAAAESK